MPQVEPQQIRKLGTHTLTRNGIIVTGANAMKPAACWNFALSGTVLSGVNPKSPAEIYEEDIGILDIDNSADPVPVVRGLRLTATVKQYPGSEDEVLTLRTNIGNAIDGDVLAQNACQLALVQIVARKNGLIPGVASDRYQLHMNARTWFGWDHWALSFRAEQPGKPRIYVQTVTGQPLYHACDRIWDEGLQGVTVNLQELNFAQVGFINKVDTFGDLCVVCGEEKRISHEDWYKCRGCHAVYCRAHGEALARHSYMDATKNCAQPGCNSQTEYFR